MNDKHNFPEKLSSADNFHCYDPRMHFYRQQDVQATNSKALLSDPVYDIASLIENPPFLQSQFPFMIYAKNVQTPVIPISSNNVCLNIERGEGFDCGITSRPTHNVSSEASFMPNFEASMNNHVVPTRKKLLQFGSPTGTFVDDHSSCELNTDCGITSWPSHKVSSEASCMPNFEAAMNNHFVSTRKKLLQFGSATNTFVDDHSSCVLNTDCGIPSWPSHKISSEGSCMPNFEASMNNHVVPAEQKHYLFRYAKETFVDGHSLFEQNTEQHFGNENSLSYQSDYIKLANLQRDGRILLSKGENERLKNNFPSSGDGKDQYIPRAIRLNVDNQLLAVSEGKMLQVEHSDFKYKEDNAILSNERGINHIENDSCLSGNGNEHYIQNTAVLNMAIQLLTSEGDNSQIPTSHFIDKREKGSLLSGLEYKQDQNDISCIDNFFVLSEENYTEVSNKDCITHLSQNEISVKYCQFYRQISPQDYDFAMNIMAYIEFLNDCTWNATVTYFEENIKNMVRYLWNKNKNAVNSNSMLERCYRDDFLNTMLYFSEFTSKTKYKIGEFLQYCVMMCQLGVFARKRNFKEAPLHVIDYLRKGIGEIEHYQSIMFEIDVINYAQELSAHTHM